VGATGFSISDLISPESSSTIRNLSAIINFARWREQKYQIYLKQKLKVNDLNKTLKVIRAENEKLAVEFVKLNEKKKRDEPQVDALQSEIAELRKTMESEHSEMEKKGEIAHDIKKEIKKLKAMDMEKMNILNKHHDIIHSLDRKIVKSPQRIKKELKLISNQIQKEQIEINAKYQKLNYDLNKLNQLKLLNQLINKRINEMKHINILKNDKYCKSEQEIKKLENIRISNEKELKSIIKTHQSLNKNLNKKKNEFSALQQEHRDKKQQIQIKNEQIDNLKVEHSKNRIKKQTEISNLDKQTELKKESLSNLLQENKNSINQLHLKYKQLVQTVKIYHQNMEKGMEKW